MPRWGSRLVPTGLEGFTFLKAGFTQELIATSTEYGVAFASDGDPVTAYPKLQRVDMQSPVVPFHGSSLRPISPYASNFSLIGLANNPDGTIYTNTGSGVYDINRDTGVYVKGPFGAAGNGLGIATDPQTSNLVYVGGSGVS
jgi:hypothetical protein